MRYGKQDTGEPDPRSIRGRSTRWNPGNRFESSHVDWDPESAAAVPAERPKTEIRTEAPVRDILSKNTSPDIPFDLGLNPYRGCEHGCAYCYARPTHEYLGYSAGLDFETKIVARPEAPERLKETFARPGYQPSPLALSGVTDPYQPAEQRLRITRGCLEVLAACRHPVSLITKNRLVLRDIDLLADLAADQAVRVTLSITTLDTTLARCLEPRTSSPKERLEAIAGLAAAGIPVGVNIAPLIPGLTDIELVPILKAAAEAGALHAGYGLLRLPHAVEPLLLDWLERHEPGKRRRVLDRLRQLRNGRLSDSAPGRRMKGQGIWADTYQGLFRTTAKRLGLNRYKQPLNTSAFIPPGGRQLELL
ncbi:MAG: PA0069 family radical SAM protein [Opitutales bacterium]